jgi:hypothetical protein
MRRKKMLFGCNSSQKRTSERLFARTLPICWQLLKREWSAIELKKTARIKRLSMQGSDKPPQVRF